MNEYYSKDSNYKIDSDLALERRRADTDASGIDYREVKADIGKWEKISISSELGARSIGRPMGYYDTLTLPRMDTLSPDEIDDAKNEVAKELCQLFDAERIFPERLLVVGLGNARLTPDAVGPESAERTEATMHIRLADDKMFEALDCSEIAVIVPGVAAKSGLDALDVVGGVCDRITPDAVIAIDSIASRSPKRLGTTIQISSTGILPGAGLGNPRRPIDEKTVGAPVIAIGVPTVINSRLLNGSENQESDRLSDMFVSPKEINDIVKNAAEIISGGINQAFGISL